MSFDKEWEGLTSFLNREFYKPDTQGLLITICTYLAHYYFDDPPIWLQILGQPGSGKTVICIDPLSQMPNVYPTSTLTKSSFLSGFGENNGILKRFKKYAGSKEIPKTQGVLTFPDLTTTLMSEDPLTRQSIIGQMRRVFDGSHEKEVGNKNKQIQWKGKCTCIAAATPDMEDFWLLNQEMGERWIKIRWKVDDENAKAYAMKAMQQMGREGTIKTELHNRIKDLLDYGMQHKGAASSEFNKYHNLVASMAEFIENCRTNVRRERKGSRMEVTGLGNKQTSTRVPKNLIAILRASTALRHSDHVEKHDIALLNRIMLDNVPQRRLTVLKILLKFYPTAVMKSEVLANTRLPKASFYRIMEDLIYLDIIEELDPHTGKKIDPNQEESLDNYKVAAQGVLIRISNRFISILRETSSTKTP